nr:uncharacterized protein LOC109161635 isoform X1 [Ipomoea batatas]
MPMTDFRVSLPLSGNGRFRNLEGLTADALCNNANEFRLAVPLQKFARNPRGSFLEAIPSFSLTGSRSHGEDEESDEYKEADEELKAFELLKTQRKQAAHVSVLECLCHAEVSHHS